MRCASVGVVAWGLTAPTLEAFAETLSADYGAAEKAVTTNDVIDGVLDYSIDPYKAKSLYHYRDSYFNEDTYQYNPSLATMSLTLAMSAFGSDGMDDNVFAHHPDNLEKVLTELGFEDFTTNPQYRLRPTRNSIGVGIANKTIKDEEGNDTTLIAIAVRGANYHAEWGGNTSIGLIGEAMGFAMARNQVIVTLASYLSAHKGEISEHPKFWIVGFSRASATANLSGNFLNYAMEYLYAHDYELDGEYPTIETTHPEASKEMVQVQVDTNDAMRSLLDAFCENDLKPRQSDLYCYGFEVPAGGVNAQAAPGEPVYSFEAKKNGNIWNLVNSEDFVPMVAPKLMGFKRYGTDVSLTEDSSGNAISNDRLSEQLEQICPEFATHWNERSIVKDGFKTYAFEDIGDMIDLEYTAVDESLIDAKNMHEFLQEAVRLLTQSTFTPRHMDRFEGTEAEKTAYLQGMYRRNYTYGLQDWAAPLAEIVMDDRQGDMLKVAAEGAQDAFVPGMVGGIMDSLVDYNHACNDGDEDAMAESRDNVEHILSVLLEGAVVAWQNDKEISALFGEGELDRMYYSANAVASVVFEFIACDANRENNFEMLGTLYAYATEIFDTHEPLSVLGYLRANDPNYSMQDKRFSQHILTISSDTAAALPAGVTVMIYRDVEDARKWPMAVITGDKVVYRNASADLANAIHVQSNKDGDVVFIVNSAQDDGRVDFEISSTKEAELKLDYRNFSYKYRDDEDPQQEWEGKPLVIDKTSPITITGTRYGDTATMNRKMQYEVIYVTSLGESEMGKSVAYGVADPGNSVTLQYRDAEGNEVASGQNPQLQYGQEYTMTCTGLGHQQPLALFNVENDDDALDVKLGEQLAAAPSEGEVVDYSTERDFQIDTTDKGTSTKIAVLLGKTGTVAETPKGEKFIYNGTERQGIVSSDAYRISTSETATDVGHYVSVLRLNNGYVWSEGDANDRYVDWWIVKGPQEPLSLSCASSVAVGDTLELSTEGGSGEGAVTYRVVGGSGSASISGSTLTAKTAGTVAVVAVKGEDDNYGEQTSEPFCITVLSANPTGEGASFVSTPDGVTASDGFGDALLTEEDNALIAEGGLIFFDVTTTKLEGPFDEVFAAEVRAAAGDGWHLAQFDAVQVSKTSVGYEDGQLRNPVTTDVQDLSNAPLQVSFKLDEDLATTDEGLHRSFAVVQTTETEDGQHAYALIDSSLDAETATLSFTADASASYAIVFKDVGKLPVPVANEGITYNGRERRGVESSYWITLSGTTTATDAGTYTAVAEPYHDYCWEDGTTGEKTIEWSIAPAPQNALSILCDTKVAVDESIGLATIGGSGDGAVTYSVESYGSEYGKAVIEDGKLKGVAAGTVAVTATKAADANHSGIAESTAIVTVVSANPKPGKVSVTSSGPCSIADSSASVLLTDSERAAVRMNTNASIKMQSEDVTETVSDEVKQEILDAAQGSTLGQVVTVDVTKTACVYEDGQVKEATTTSIGKSASSASVKVALPDELVNHDKNKVRTYQVVSLYDGACKVHRAVYLDNEQALLFSASSFGTYGIVYQDEDKPVDPEENKVVAGDKYTVASGKNKGTVYVVMKAPDKNGKNGTVAYAKAPAGATSASIPASVTFKGKSFAVVRIAKSAFKGNKKLSSVRIPSSVKAIGASAFQDCVRLTSVSIPGSVRSIEKNAFRGCSRLAKVTFGRGVATIGASAFRNTAIKTLSLPTSVTTIGGYAFAGCTKLSKATLGAGLTKMGTYVFRGDKRLKTLTIKSKKLTKTRVRGSLKGSSLTKVRVPASKLRAYKKIFTAKNCGKKVKVVRI